MNVNRALVAVLACLVLAACGGGGGGGGAGGSASIEGSVVKGPLAGATVAFFSLNPDGSKKAQIGTVITDGQGHFATTLDPAPTAPFLGEATGGSYIDEALGTTVTLYGNDVLRVVVPAGTTDLTISPLTHMAAARALALAAGGTPLATAVASANLGVAAQYGIADPVHTMPAAAYLATPNLATTRDQRLYSLVLAGFSQEANTLGVRAIDLADALAADAADGTLDGQHNGTPVDLETFTSAVLALPAAAGTSDLHAAIDAFAASARNKTGLTDVPMPVDAVPLGASAADALYIGMPRLPAATVSQQYNAALTATGGTPPYTCALKNGSALPAGFTLAGATCGLSGTGAATPSASAPFTVTLSDSAVPPAHVDFVDLQVTTLAAPPTVTPIAATMTRQLWSSVPVASASGGSSPYAFIVGNAADGAPPTGTTLWPDGTLRGTPSVSGVFAFPVCAVDLVGAEACKTVSVTVEEPVAVGLLQVTLAGAGTGSVLSTPGGVDCGTACSAYFPQGALVVLAAQADAHSLFKGWSGACSGTGSCVVDMGSSADVTATFDEAPQLFTGTFNVSGVITNLQDDCVFNVNAGGTISVTLALGTMVDGVATVTGSSTVSGQWANAVASGTTCVSGNDTYTATSGLLGTNLGFTSAAGTFPRVSLAGALNGTTIDGTVTLTFGNSSGQLVSAFTLVKQ